MANNGVGPDEEPNAASEDPGVTGGQDTGHQGGVSRVGTEGRREKKEVEKFGC